MSNPAETQVLPQVEQDPAARVDLNNLHFDLPDISKLLGTTSPSASAETQVLPQVEQDPAARVDLNNLHFDLPDISKLLGTTSYPRTEIDTNDAWTRNQLRRRRWLAGSIVGGLILTTGAVASHKGNVEQVKPQTAKTTLVDTAPTTASTTPTTEKYVPYRTSPVDSPLNEQGELIQPAFKVAIPGICENDIFVYEMDQNRLGEIGLENATPADIKVKDASPLADGCVKVDQYAAKNGKFVRRAERTRNNYDVVNGEKVDASYYQPIAVHVNDNMYPGEEGNFVIVGHGSTENAAFADTAAMEVGDKMFVTRDDGKIFTYQMIAREVIKDVPSQKDKSPEADQRRIAINNQIWSYQNEQSKAVASIVRCGDESGNPGSDAARVVDRFVLVSQ